MVWSYAKSVDTYFEKNLFKKYSEVFDEVWGASAFKGASGELAVITSVDFHYNNHLSWLNLIKELTEKKVIRFRGIVLTGWSRYDHFLALCDLLPQAIPSLVFNLKTVRNGSISRKDRLEIQNNLLKCEEKIPWYESEAFEPVLCKFPGSELYDAILPYNYMMNMVDDALEYANKFMSPMNLEYSYAYKMRLDEVLDKLINAFQELNVFKFNFIEASKNVYFNETVNEWLTVYIMPHMESSHTLIKKIKKISNQNDWKPRPLQITLKEFKL
jgi:hexosaminidase